MEEIISASNNPNIDSKISTNLGDLKQIPLSVKTERVMRLITFFFFKLFQIILQKSTVKEF